MDSSTHSLHLQLCQDYEHTYEGLIRCLEYFGGVPKEVLLDNQKSAVLKHPKSGKVRFNGRFQDLAEWYGFTPRAPRPSFRGNRWILCKTQ